MKNVRFADFAACGLLPGRYAFFTALFVAFWIGAASHSRAQIKDPQLLEQIAISKMSQAGRPQEANWRLLWFDKIRAVKKVKVQIFEYVFFSSEGRKIVADVETDNPQELENFIAGLTRATRFTPDESWGSGVLSEPFGCLEITTSRDTFKIYLDIRFILESENWSPDNCFWSWTLAKAVDDLQFQKTGKRLIQRRFEALSGEDWLRAERENYTKRSEKTNAEAAPP